jgi:hypothetical protein
LIIEAISNIVFPSALVLHVLDRLPYPDTLPFGVPIPKTIDTGILEPNILDELFVKYLKSFCLS